MHHGDCAVDDTYTGVLEALVPRLNACCVPFYVSHLSTLLSRGRSHNSALRETSIHIAPHCNPQTWMKLYVELVDWFGEVTVCDSVQVSDIRLLAAVQTFRHLDSQVWALHWAGTVTELEKVPDWAAIITLNLKCFLKKTALRHFYKHTQWKKKWLMWRPGKQKCFTLIMAKSN